MSVLEVNDLVVSIGGVPAVDGVSFSIEPGERVGLIGESGSGKSLTALAIMGLLPDAADARGSVRLDGREVLGLDEAELGRLRGTNVSMIFQEPMTALDPMMRIGDQIAEVLRIHDRVNKKDAHRAALELLHRVRIEPAEERSRAYPHQLSGGQRQRVMIAAAIACGPNLLLADEPTTALDVTVQAEILRLLEQLVDEEGSAMLLITHDLPVISSVCKRVLVMYGGKIVESGPVSEVFRDARHPYTKGLIDAIPKPGAPRPRRLATVAGVVPPLGGFPSGCVFRNRCPRATEVCVTEPPLDPVEGPGRRFACWHPVHADV